MSDKLEANEWSQIDKFALKITEIIIEKENKSLASVIGKYDRGNVRLFWNYSLQHTARQSVTLNWLSDRSSAMTVLL